MEALALAVATAVIQYLVDKADLTKHVRGWLKRDPASLAYQRALLRAYAAFARSDPVLAQSFFDETYLAGAAVPELAKQLTRDEHASGAELARVWAATLYADALAEQRAQWATNERVMHACADFLQWLENELKREEVFQPLFDSRALDALETRVDELTRALTAQRDEAMKRAEQYQPVINQIARQSSVNISDSSNVVVYGDIVGGDKNVHNYFYGNFTSLDDYYISPESVYQRVKINEFVGREWLVGRIDAFLNDASRTSGMFRIEGEAGVGKTAFLAHLVRERGYLHLFAEQVPGDNNVERALLSLGAQLVSRYRLDPYADRNTLPAIAGFSDFLYKLLNMASQRLTAGEKIIVVCDALDEAGNGTNGNVFGLPTTLPDNVYFILSQRPVSVRLDVKCEIHNERVKPDNAENLRDVADYLRAMAARPQIAQQLRARNYPDAEFVRVLSDKSGGVWMYLQYVLDEIQRGSRHPLELDALPNGLVDYYLAYWGDWRAGRNHRGKGEDEWYALYLPLLTTLAAAQEPIPLDTLIAWAGVNATTQYQVRNLLREQWRAFITESEVRGVSHFALYHASLRDFLTGKVDTNALSSADINFIDELRDGTRAAHQRIIANFTERCRGTWTDLIHDDYARQYLCLHLEGAEEYDVLAALVAGSDTWAKTRYQQEETWSGYLTDLERVWAFAEQKENVGWQIRCALIESTIHSLAANISPNLLVLLVETEMWGPARAVAHIAHMPSDWDRSRAIEKLAPLLPIELVQGALVEARGIRDEGYRARSLSDLAEHLNAWDRQTVLAEALRVARSMQNDWSKENVLRELAPHMRAEQLSETLTAAQEIQDKKARSRALIGLAKYLSEEKKEHVVSENLSAAREVQDEYARTRALIDVVEYLPEAEKTELLSKVLTPQGFHEEFSRSEALKALARDIPTQMILKVLASVREMRDEMARAIAVSGLAHLPKQFIPETLTIVREIQDEDACAVALGGLVEHLPAEFIRETFAIAEKIENEHIRARALGYFEGHLPQELMPEAIVVANGIANPPERALVLSRFARDLPDAQKVQVVLEALAVAYAICDEFDRVRALSSLAEHLNSEERLPVLVEALRLLLNIHNEYSRAHALRSLVAYLPDELIPDAFAMVCSIQNEYAREHALSGLVAYLPDNLTPDALEAARGIQEEYLRVSVLSELIAYLDEEKEQVTHEAMAAALEIEDGSDRVIALCKLARNLPEEDKLRIISETLVAAREIQDSADRVQALSLLAEHMYGMERAAIMSEALVVARGIRDPYACADALRDLAEYLPDELKREALTVASGIKYEQARAFALGNLAPYLPDKLKHEALTLANDMEREFHRADVLCDLAEYLPDELIPHVLAAIWNIQNASDRVLVLSHLLPHLGDLVQLELYPEVFQTAIVLPSYYDHANVLNSIVISWENLQFKEFDAALWKQSLHDLARHPRKELLNDLSALLPLIKHLGGQVAVGEMLYALRDVGRWWP